MPQVYDNTEISFKLQIIPNKIISDKRFSDQAFSWRTLPTAFFFSLIFCLFLLNGKVFAEDGPHGPEGEIKPEDPVEMHGEENKKSKSDKKLMSDSDPRSHSNSHSNSEEGHGEKTIPVKPPPPKTGNEHEPKAIGTEVCGALTLAAEWTAAESPYIVTNDIFIPGNSRLRIGPGVTVRFAKPRPCKDDKLPQEKVDWSDSTYSGIKIDGAFYCLGTEENPVVFEPMEGKPGGIGWDGLRLSGQNSGTTEVSWGVFRGANQAIIADRSSFFVHHSLFLGNNTGIALNLRGDINIVNCNFINNISAGIVARKAAPHIVNNIFLDNLSYGIWADGRPSIQILNNAFWNNREENCRKCPYTILQLNAVNANKDTSDTFGNLLADPIFLGTSSFDLAKQADLQTPTPDHLIKDPKLAKIQAKSKFRLPFLKKKSTGKNSDEPFQPIGKGDYLLSQYSKLIDAGYKSPDFKDRDGSANDIGYHGGPQSRITKDPY